MSLDIFEQFKNNISNIDPVYWCEKYLTLDGKPFKISKGGYKPFTDMYRYIGIKSLEKNSRHCVVLKGRQIGLTTAIANLSLFLVASNQFGINGRPPMRLMHAFPSLIHVFRYAKTKLNPTIATSIVDGDVKPGKKKVSYIESKLDKESASNDSLQYKQFINGNYLQIESTGLDGSRLRGGTLDGLFFDEIQDMSGIAIQNSLKLLNQSQYGQSGKGIAVFFGTPKQKGSYFWNMWNDSSQQYYHLGCEKCGEYFPLYAPGTNWEKVWLYGYIVKCEHCGYEQNKLEAAERGKWIVHGNPDAKFTGFHLNQLYMPNFTKETILGEKPENNPNTGEITWQNEVLGEFYAGDAKPISSDEIRELCADVGRKFKSCITIKDNKKVYAGFDWGSKQVSNGSENSQTTGQSYSCGVILSEEANILSIEYATMLKRNNFTEKKEIVEQMLRQYSVKLAIGDIGYANDLSEHLQNTYGDRFLASRATHQLRGHFKYCSDQFPKEIMFERDYLIAEMFDLMKRGLIRFPYGDYEKIEWLISHCCSMEIKTTANRVNEPVSRYIKGNSQNDGFMALMNAYLAYKFDKTNGFNMVGSGSLVMPDNKSGKILAVSGYIPRMR